MLGIPKPGVAELVAECGEVDDLAQRVGGGGALGHWREVKNGKGQGAHAALYRHLPMERQWGRATPSSFDKLRMRATETTRVFEASW